MSKEIWMDCHEQAIAEAMDADDSLDWTRAYNSDVVAKRADEIYRDRCADLIDAAREREKYRSAQ